MHSEYWNDKYIKKIQTASYIKYHVKSNYKNVIFQTIGQWNKQGYFPNDENCGEYRTTNLYGPMRCLYLFNDEVHKGTPEELSDYKEKINAQRRRHYAYKKAKKEAEKKELERIEREQEEFKIKQKEYEKKFLDAIAKYEEESNTGLIDSEMPDTVIYDIETTGTRPGSEILEICILNLSGDTLYYNLIKPFYCDSWVYAQEVHNIRPQDVKYRPTLADEALKIARILRSAKTIVGCHLSWSIPFLNGIIRFDDERKYITVPFQSNKYNAYKDCQEILKIYKNSYIK